MDKSMGIGNVGIWSFELRGRSGAETDAAAELQERGWGALWIPGAGGPGIWADAERLLAAGSDAKVALGVLSIWSPDASVASEERARLVGIYGDRLITGLGVSNPRAAAAAGRTFDTPIRAMTRFLDALDAEADPLPRNQRLVGALGPKMVGLAGARTAGIHPFLVTPESSDRNRSILGRTKLIAPQQAVVLETDPEKARAIARRGIGMFYTFPSYQQNLKRLGFADEDFTHGGSDRLIDATVAWGSLDAVRRRVAEHLDAGADHVALQVLTDHQTMPAAEWRELGDALLAKPVPEE